MDTLHFIHALERGSIPEPVLDAARRHLLDLLGVAAAGSRTKLTRIVSAHAVSEFGGTPGARLLFDGRRASATGAALAGGMQIDSPLDDAALEAKFLALAEPVLGVPRSELLLEAVRVFGEAASLDAFNALVYPRGTGTPARSRVGRAR